MQTPEEKPVRYRETEESEPSGFNRVVHKRVRVVEGPAPIPAGAVPTTDEPHGWQAVEN